MLSNVKTNIYTTNASFLFNNEVGKNPIFLYSNPGGGPAQTTTALNVPAVTDSNGDFVCAIVSKSTNIYNDQSVSVTTIPTATSVITEVIVEILYTSVGSGYVSATGTTTVTSLISFIEVERSLSTGGSFASTESGIYVFTVNSYAEAYFGPATTKPTGTIISFATPYIYLPTRGATDATGNVADSCTRGLGPEYYGYPVQQAIDFAASQYPEIGSCLSGGPSALPNTHCNAVSPETEGASGDLTSSTIITVTPGSASAIPSALPETESISPIAPAQTIPQPVVTPSTQVGNSQTPGSSNTLPTAASNNPSPSGSAVSASFAEGSIASAIASLIGAQPIAGSQTTISGTPNIIISTATTIPLAPSAPSISCLTTVISGSTNVIVSLATTVPLSQGVQSLPGSITIVSGTLNVVLGPSGTTSVPINSQFPGLTGSTTIVPGSAGGSSTYIIVTGPTTIPVVVGISPAQVSSGGSGDKSSAIASRTSSASTSSSGTSAPLQASGTPRAKDLGSFPPANIEPTTILRPSDAGLPHLPFTFFRLEFCIVPRGLDTTPIEFPHSGPSIDINTIFPETLHGHEPNAQYSEAGLVNLSAEPSLLEERHLPGNSFNVTVAVTRL
ncbi:hypothetical protein G7Y89_g6966 [Cudoniella acicularis]|uniref:Uncharacterized protein n=1 Tax=Cudoniella acicularis TaxID=354080 RepID=A0A8H4W2I6_9HELO|nr:hypothetical protein G7Y89_g6966 [Cudoniella acicularis]